jgi:glycosyltransferase involved in cell wall biosynthesis
VTNIALISTYPPKSCGIASYTRDLVDAILAADRSASITVLAEDGATSSSQGATVWPCFDGEGEYVAPILDRLRRLMPDVVHIQHEYGIFGVDERFHQLLTGIHGLELPVVVTLHTVHTALSFDLGCSWRRARQSLADIDIEGYQLAVGMASDVVIAHQKAPISEVLIRQGLPRERVVTIAHGTPTARSGEDRAAQVAPRFVSKPPIVVGFGYFERSKNYPVLIEALPIIHAMLPQTRLILGGHIRYPSDVATSFRSHCEEKINDLGLRAHVDILYDPVPDEHVNALLFAADAACFVYDEDTRSSSGALHRAIGCGVPVIASRIPKFAEVSEISDELLVNPRSPEQVARVLGRLLSDTDFRYHIQRRGEAFARRTSWDCAAARHLTVYRKVIRNSADRRNSSITRSRALTPA